MPQQQRQQQESWVYEKIEGGAAGTPPATRAHVMHMHMDLDQCTRRLRAGLQEHHLQPGHTSCTCTWTLRNSVQEDRARGCRNTISVSRARVNHVHMDL